MAKLVTLYHELLLATFTGEIADKISDVYSSLWCSQTLKTGNRCKSRAIHANFCKLHSRPRCKFILKSGRNKGLQCSKYAAENKTCCSIHNHVVNTPAINNVEDTPAVNNVEDTLDVNNVEYTPAVNNVEDTLDVNNVEYTPAVNNVEDTPAVNNEDTPDSPKLTLKHIIQERVKVALSKSSNDVLDTSTVNNEYILNKCVLKEQYPKVPILPDACAIRIKTGKLCGKPSKTNNYRCGLHKDRDVDASYLPATYIPKHVWIKGEFWSKLVDSYDWNALASEIKTPSLYESETLGDNDDVIDEKAALPQARPHRCRYGNTEHCTPWEIISCHEKVEFGHYYCKKHKVSEKSFIHGCLDPDDNLWWPGRMIPDRSCHMWHFRRLHIFAWLTSRGFIAVGKLWYGTFAEQLTLCNLSRYKSYNLLPSNSSVKVDEYGGHDFIDAEEKDKFSRRYKYDNNMHENEDETTYIKRCHNNGLLYKIVPQKYLLYQYDLSDLDTLPGKGFVSFEQMIRDRPKLYIKYWNVWNGQIQRAQQFIICKGHSIVELHKKFGLLSPPFWKRFHEDAFMFGLFNVIIPAPSLEQVKNIEFNPFKYCENWVATNCPHNFESPYFPPMYIIYPFPDKEYEKMQKRRFESSIKKIALFNRKLVQHYHDTIKTETPYTWLQWLKYGNGDNLLSSSSLEVPLRLRDRIGLNEFPLKS